jgi:hypothetical protein
MATCQNVQCQNEFTPNGRKRRFCSKRCRIASHNSPYISPYPGLPTGTVGAIAELRVSADLLARGYEVFRALSSHCSCDLAVLKNNQLQRVEVRTAYANPRTKKVYCTLPKVNRREILAKVLPDRIEYEGLEAES